MYKYAVYVLCSNTVTSDVVLYFHFLCVYNNPSWFPSIPTISEDEARDALLSEVEKHCCYGKKAARDLVFLNITPSSAFHVSAVLLFVTNFTCMPYSALVFADCSN